MRGGVREVVVCPVLLIHTGISLCWPIIKFTLATVLIQPPILLWYIAHLCYSNGNLLVKVFCANTQVFICYSPEKMGGRNLCFKNSIREEKN